MSLAKKLLNPYLRWTEKPHLLRATPEKMRRSIEMKAKLFFWRPLGTRYGKRDLHHEGKILRAVTVNTPKDQGPLVLYFHGGGYVFGSPHTHKAMLAKLAQLSGCAAVLPHYRLAPEHAFPAPPEDAMTAYRAVMDYPGGIVLGGDSAGGGLALSLLGEIVRLGLQQPVGTFAFSPLTDLSFSAPSIVKNDPVDVVLPGTRVGEFADVYLQGADPNDPRASPLLANFEGASPVWITVGDTEILLDDATRMAEVLRAQGVDVTLTVEDDLPHVWPIFHNTLPEARRTLQALASWIADRSACGTR